MTAIDACPFCGSRSVQLETYEASPGSGYRVRCLDCDAEGPVVFGGLLARHCRPKHRREAIGLWNGRAPKPATPRPKKRRPRKPLTVEDINVGTARSRRK